MNIGDVLGGFELQQVLGRGGFGTVYLGRDSDGQLAAVKVLHHHYADSPQFRARFKAEVEHSMRVVDFCIARVLDADPDGDPPWVATEYVDGPTLRQQVHSGEVGGGPLPEGDLYRIAVATATALTAIHASDVVHRDFTPSNIMIAPDGIRVIDFGIARALESSPVSASALLGTPRYMAPEQFLGSRVTPAIDVFAWGSVIAFAGTGRDIFTGENLAVTLRKVLFDKPDLTGLPDNLAAVVRWCLYKDPQLRPTSNRLLATLLGVEEPAGGHTPEPLANYGGRTHHDILTMGLQIGQGSRTIDISAIPAITQAPPDRDELFEFGGESYSSAAALAQGMQRNWDKALDLLRNAPHRQDLLRWLPERQERARWIVGQLPEDWGGADVQAAHLIVELAPSLAPLFNGLDMSWSALFSTRDGRAWPYRGEEHRRLIRLVERDNLLEPFSRHSCMGADHGCESNEGCAYYEQVARQTSVMFDTLRKCEAWLEQLGKGFGLAPREISPEERGDLVHLLATHPLAEREKHDLAAWAVERIPKGPELDQVFRAVYNSDEPWPAAVAFRVHGDDFRELVERFEKFERLGQAGAGQPATDRSEGGRTENWGTESGGTEDGRTKPQALGLRSPEPPAPLVQRSEPHPPETRASEVHASEVRARESRSQEQESRAPGHTSPEPQHPEPASGQGPVPGGELDRERLAEKKDLLEQRDPKTMVRFFYVLGATLVVLAGVVGVVWDSMVVLAVVFAVTGLLFGVIGRVMAQDHEKALRALDEEWDSLPGLSDLTGLPDQRDRATESARRREEQFGTGGASEGSGVGSAKGSGSGSGSGSETRSGTGPERGSEGVSRVGPEVTSPVRPSAADPFGTGPSEERGVSETSGGSGLFSGEGDIDRSTSSVTWFGKRSQEGPSIGSTSDRPRLRPSENMEKWSPEWGGPGRTPLGLDADAQLAERGTPGRTRPVRDPEATEDWSLGRGAAAHPEGHRAVDQASVEPPAEE